MNLYIFYLLDPDPDLSIRIRIREDFFNADPDLQHWFLMIELVRNSLLIIAECGNEEGISTSVGSTSTPLTLPPAEVS